VVVATSDALLMEATSNWTDIVEIVALSGSGNGIVGVMRDGSVVSTEEPK